MGRCAHVMGSKEEAAVVRQCSSECARAQMVQSTNKAVRVPLPDTTAQMNDVW